MKPEGREKSFLYFSLKEPALPINPRVTSYYLSQLFIKNSISGLPLLNYSPGYPIFAAARGDRGELGDGNSSNEVT
jgi:hypothetical protein